MEGRNSKITEAIVYFICKDNQPFSVVEDIGFKKLMKEVAPLYKVPTRNTIKARILQKYDVVSSKFKCLLKEIEDITITTDIWSEMMTTKSCSYNTFCPFFKIMFCCIGYF